MRRGWRRFAIPLALLLALGLLWALLPRRHGDRPIDASGRRVLVADGDTFRLSTETIRLAGIDAVERAQFCTDTTGGTWSCGETALKALEAIAARGEMRCTALGRDVYGRTLARCLDGSGQDVAAAIVEAGWALSDRGGRYAAQEEAAHAGRRGIWAGAFDPPADWRAQHGVRTKTVGQ